MTTNEKWCTYSHINGDLPQHIGKATNISKISCNIQYTDGQLYARHSWDIDFVRIFDTLESAICFMYTNSGYRYMSDIKQDLSSHFSKDAKNVNWATVLRPLKIKKLTKR